MKLAPAFVSLVLAVSCAGPAPAPPPVDASEAIRHVLDVDRVIARQRDLSTDTVSLATAVATYVRGIDAIDFTGCPPEFVAAFRRHRDAWESAIPYLETHAELRGEMHVLFDRLRAEEPVALAAVLRPIMSTWDEVEPIAQRHDEP